MTAGSGRTRCRTRLRLGTGVLVIAASMVGGVVAGPALGRAIEWSGIRTVPVLLGVVSALCLTATLWLTRTTRPTTSM